MPARVATWVRGRGVRLEMSANAPRLTANALAAWTRGEVPLADRQRADTGSLEPLAGRCILVIDDDLNLLKMVQRRLRPTGCTVEVTDSPSVALAKVTEDGVDAVLMDWMLPEIPGRQLLDALKGQDRHLPVAVMSGQLWWDGAHEDVVSFGADAVLEKPLDIWRMVDWLQAVTRDPGGFV